MERQQFYSFSKADDCFPMKSPSKPPRVVKDEFSWMIHLCDFFAGGHSPMESSDDCFRMPSKSPPPRVVKDEFLWMIHLCVFFAATTGGLKVHPMKSFSPSPARMKEETIHLFESFTGYFSYDEKFFSSGYYSTTVECTGKQQQITTDPFDLNSSLVNPLFLFWMIGNLNLTFSHTLLLYASFVVISSKIRYSIEAYINDVTKALQNLNPFQPSSPTRRYHHENSDSWDLLRRSRRRISQIRLKKSFPSDESLLKNVDNTPVAVVDVVVDEIVNGIIINEEEKDNDEDIIIHSHRDIRKERREIFALLHKSKRRLEEYNDFRSTTTTKKEFKNNNNNIIIIDTTAISSSSSIKGYF